MGKSTISGHVQSLIWQIFGILTRKLINRKKKKARKKVSLDVVGVNHPSFPILESHRNTKGTVESYDFDAQQPSRWRSASGLRVARQRACAVAGDQRWVDGEIP